MKKISICILVGLIIVGMTPSVTALDGPVQIPPLGMSVVDSETLPPDDPGYGEDWGRSGGRTMTFTTFQVSQYNQLK